MVQRAEREPSMKEIVVALRESTRSADRMHPFAVAGPSRGSRAPRSMIGSADCADLRDSEIERLLNENAQLNARIISVLKVLEREQADHAETAAAAAAQDAETAPTELDRAAVQTEVRAALEAELRPALLVLLRLLQKQFAESSAVDRKAAGKASLPPAPAAGPSEWMVELMRQLDDKAPAPSEPVAAGDPPPRRPRLRRFMADVVNAMGFEPHAATARQRFT